MHKIAAVTAVLAFLLVHPQQAKAQKLSLAELVLLNQYSIDSFDTYVTDGGYKFYKPVITGNSDTAVLYAYKQNDSTFKAEHFVRKYLPNKTGEKIIAYQTVYVSEYLQLKKDIKDAGFTETGSTSPADTGGLSLLFEKNGCKIYLNSLMGNTDPKKKVAVYEIKIVTAKGAATAW